MTGWFEMQADALNSIVYKAPLVSLSEEPTFSSISFSIGVSVALIFYLALKLAHGLAVKLNGKVPSFWKVAAVLGSIFLVYAGYYFMLLWNTPISLIFEKVREGTFGDSFGTLNALFSGLAFSGVLLTMLFQRKDLLETRNQIANQQIESQFYNMLDLQQEVVRNFDIQNKEQAVVVKGRDCFNYWQSGLVHFYRELSRESNAQYPAAYTHDEKILRAYEALFDRHKTDLGLYFRSLYSIFRFIDNCSHKEKGQFALVVRSLLSDNELILLFYNCLSSKGGKFKSYVYRYALFDNLEVGLLLRSADINFFSYEAYGSNRAILDMLESSPGRSRAISPKRQ